MTHNQIDYWKMRNEKLNNEQRNQETKRYNLVQEELKKVDQDLQRDLMNINARYKQKELDLASEELKWKKRFQDTQLKLESRKLDLASQQNAVNAMVAQETKRSNLVKETVARDQLEIQKGQYQLQEQMQPYTQSKIWSETQVENARADLVKQQTKTESTRAHLNMTQMFNNTISPFINLAGSILRAVH